MKNEKVYLWSDLPADIAVAQGMKSDSAFKALDAIEDKDSDAWWLEAQKLLKFDTSEHFSCNWRSPAQ
jgi:hypothetical protein